MNTRPLPRLLAVALSCLAAGPASAADFSLDLDVSRLAIEFDPAGFDDNTAETDSLAVEIMYHADDRVRTFLGHARVDEATGFELSDPFTFVDFDHTAWYVGVEGCLPFAKSFAAFARAARRRADFGDDTEYSTSFGAGLEWRFTERWALRVTQTRYELFSDTEIVDTALGVRFDLN